MAFLDDDEVADPQWLAALLVEMRRGFGDVVFGPVQARYGEDAPAWARRADLHSVRPVIRAGGRIETGYSGNVLIRREVIGRIRFEIALGRSGGEDTHFFTALRAAGARLTYCPAAIAYENVTAARAQLRWLLKRAFRSGQVHGRSLGERSGARSRHVAVAAAKALYFFLAAALRVGSASGWRRFLVRAALHAGVVAKLLGVRELQLY